MWTSEKRERQRQKAKAKHKERDSLLHIKNCGSYQTSLTKKHSALPDSPSMQLTWRLRKELEFIRLYSEYLYLLYSFLKKKVNSNQDLGRLRFDYPKKKFDFSLILLGRQLDNADKFLCFTLSANLLSGIICWKIVFTLDL